MKWPLNQGLVSLRQDAKSLIFLKKIKEYTLQRHRGRAIRKWWGGPDNKNKLKTKIIEEKEERKGNKNEAEGFTCIRKKIPHKQVICTTWAGAKEKKTATDKQHQLRNKMI